MMFDEIEWSQIIDGIDLSRYCAGSRSFYVERYRKKRKKKEGSDDGFLLPGDYPYISTSKMSNVCILLSTCKGS